MKYSDYIVTIDENGQPYIEHVSWGGVKSSVKGAANRAHKYLLKVGEGAKAQYAYTKEEVDRLLGRGRQKVKDVTGATAKEKRDKAYADMVRSSRDAGRAQTRAASSAVNVAKLDSVRREAIEQKQAARVNALSAINNNYNAGITDNHAKAALRDAGRDYQNAKDNASKWITTNKDYEALDAAKEKYDRALDDRRRAMSERKIAEKEEKEAISKYDHAEHDVVPKANATIRADQKAKDAADDADYEKRWADYYKRQYEQASEDYSKTPLAKVKEAASSAKDKASDAIDKVKGVASSAKDKASDAVDKAKNAASSAKDKAKEVGGQIKEATDSMLKELSPGYRARERMKDAEAKYEEAAKKQSDALDKYYKGAKAEKENSEARDSSAHASAAYDKGVYDQREYYDNYGERIDRRDKAASDMYDARREYSKTPLSKLEKFAKDPVGTVKDAADDAASEVKWAVDSAVFKTQVKAAERKVDSVEKLMDKYKRPSMDIYTYDRQTGKTIRAQEQYDTYMGKANDLLNTMKANAAKGEAPSREQIAEVKRLYERAIGH